VQANVVQPNGIVCPACTTPLPTPSLAVQLDLKIRAHIAKYYLAWTVCDDEACGARTRMMGVYGKRCLGLVKEGCKGSVRLEVSSSMPMLSAKLTTSTRTCNYTISCSSTDICSMARRPSPKFGVQLDMVSHCPSCNVPADIPQRRSLL
jgi:hypothetical protein